MSLPLIIESSDPNIINQYLSDHYFLQNIVSEISPENETIGLPAIKYLLDRAKFSHPSHTSAVFLIRDAHFVTSVGQNTLLKTLEESRPWQQFILTTHSRHSLLSTITSRCQIINLSVTNSSTWSPESLKNFATLLKNIPNLISETDHRLTDNPKNFLSEIIDNLRIANRSLPTSKRVRIISLALMCSSDLDRNINPKLALDHFLIKSSKLLANSLK